MLANHWIALFAITVALPLTGCARLTIHTQVFDDSGLNLAEPTATATFRAMLTAILREEAVFSDLTDTRLPLLMDDLDKLYGECAKDKTGAVSTERQTNVDRIRASARGNLDTALGEIRSKTTALESQLVFNPTWDVNRLEQQRATIRTTAGEREQLAVALLDKMTRSKQVFITSCLDLSDAERARQNQSAVQFATARLDFTARSERADAALSATVLSARKVEDIADNPEIVSATDPNLKILLDPANNDRWRKGLNESETYGSFGKGQHVIVQNSLVDYRVKKVSNDITQAVMALRGAIDEVVRTAAGIYGIPPKSGDDAPQTGDQPERLDGLADIQTDVRIARGRTDDLARLRESLSTYLEPRIDAYDSATDATEREKILAEIRGRLRDTVNQLQVITNAAASVAGNDPTPAK